MDLSQMLRSDREGAVSTEQQLSRSPSEVKLPRDDLVGVRGLSNPNSNLGRNSADVGRKHLSPTPPGYFSPNSSSGTIGSPTSDHDMNPVSGSLSDRLSDKLQRSNLSGSTISRYHDDIEEHEPYYAQSPGQPPKSYQQYAQMLSGIAQQQSQSKRNYNNMDDDYDDESVGMSSATSSTASNLSSISQTSPTRRQAHIVSEQKRRQNIKDGFEELRRIIPDCHSGNDSKALILRKASMYIQQLQAEVGRLRNASGSGGGGMMHSSPHYARSHHVQQQVGNSYGPSGGMPLPRPKSYMDLSQNAMPDHRSPGQMPPMPIDSGLRGIRPLNIAPSHRPSSQPQQPWPAHMSHDDYISVTSLSLLKDANRPGNNHH